MEHETRHWEQESAHWTGHASPWRPSPGDIHEYARLAGDAIYGRVLVLGATPELRDLVARAHPHELPVIADSSLAMLTQMSRLLRDANPSSERWLVVPWQRLPLPAGTFDLILGDLIWWVLSIPEQRIVRDTIARLLTPEGVLVTRIRVRDSLFCGLDPDSLIQAFMARAFERAPNERALVHSTLVSILYDATADMATHTLDRERVARALLEAAGNTTDESSRRVLRLLATRASGKQNWTVQERKDFFDLLAPRLTLVKEAYAGDYWSRSYPVCRMVPTWPC